MFGYAIELAKAQHSVQKNIDKLQKQRDDNQNKRDKQVYEMSKIPKCMNNKIEIVEEIEFETVDGFDCTDNFKEIKMLIEKVNIKDR